MVQGRAASIAYYALLLLSPVISTTARRDGRNPFLRQPLLHSLASSGPYARYATACYPPRETPSSQILHSVLHIGHTKNNYSNFPLLPFCCC
uniref:Putative secreted peptide n=1 Tax=Anopheles braziliensis TaxID=58242 RepID=A0A2M3ZVA9_9DIPT